MRCSHVQISIINGMLSVYNLKFSLLKYKHSRLCSLFFLHYERPNHRFYVCLQIVIFFSFILLTGFDAIVTRRLPHVEHNLRVHLSLPPIFSGVRVARSLVFCVMFCLSLFVLFMLVIVLSVCLRYSASEYLFGIFNLLFI